MTDIDPEDLDVSTTRLAPRRGGPEHASVDSYVRITHKPTGITVERDSERSQLQNKANALDEIRRQLAQRGEPDLREHIIRLHPHLHSADKARAVTRTQAWMARSHAEDHRNRGSTNHRHGPSHWEHPDAWPAGWRDGSGVVMIGDQPGSAETAPLATWHAFSPDQMADLIAGVTRSRTVAAEVMPYLAGDAYREFWTERRDLAGQLIGGARWRAEYHRSSLSWSLHLLESEPEGVA
jgi:hypothetical protein